MYALGQSSSLFNIMRFVDVRSLIFASAVGALASAILPAQLFSRDDPRPAINASIIDHNGLDITSSFQIMVYNEPEEIAATTNLTDRRRRNTVLSRPIMDCPMPNSVFVDSVCTYEDGNQSG